MPRYADDDDDYEDDGAEHRPGVWEWMRPWVEDEYANSGDPRQRMFPHDDGRGGVCDGADCRHVMPSADPDHPRARRLAAYEAGEPITVPHHIATGQRWTGNGWTDPVFELPWDRKTVRHVVVAPDDTVTPAESPPWGNVGD